MQVKRSHTKSVIYLIACSRGNSRWIERQKLVLRNTEALRHPETWILLNSIILFEKVSLPPGGGSLDVLLSRRERHQIHWIRTAAARKLNINDDLKCFLWDVYDADVDFCLIRNVFNSKYSGLWILKVGVKHLEIVSSAISCHCLFQRLLLSVLWHLIKENCRYIMTHTSETHFLLVVAAVIFYLIYY